MLRFSWRGKTNYLEKLGLAHAIDYNTTDFVDYVRENTGGEGVEVILDPVGGATLRKSYELLAPLGRVVSYGLSAAVSSKRRNWPRTLAAWLKTPRFGPLDMIGRNVGVFGFHLALLGSKESMVREAFDSIVRKTVAGPLAPVISAEFPLTAEGAIEAHHYLHDRRNIGKFLLTHLP